MDTARYVIAVLVVISLPPAIVWWFVIHPFVEFWRRFGVKPTMWTVSILSLAFLGVLYRYKDVLVMKDLGTSWGTVVVGVVLAVVTTVLALARRRQLGMRTLTGVPELEAGGRGGELLEEGVYAVVRNPRYIEVVLGTVAYALFSNYVGAYVMAIALLPLIHLVVLMEEPELEQRFGAEYRDYKRRVPRYIPRRKNAV